MQVRASEHLAGAIWAERTTQKQRTTDIIITVTVSLQLTCLYLYFFTSLPAFLLYVAYSRALFFNLPLLLTFHTWGKRQIFPKRDDVTQRLFLSCFLFLTGRRKVESGFFSKKGTKDKRQVETRCFLLMQNAGSKKQSEREREKTTTLQYYLCLTMDTECAYICTHRGRREKGKEGRKAIHIEKRREGSRAFILLQ